MEAQQADAVFQWVMNLLSGESNSGRHLSGQLDEAVDDRTIDRFLKRSGMRQAEDGGLRQKVEAYQRQQLEMLHQAADLVKRDGVLVYATCSMESEENEQLIAQFLARHPEYCVTSAREFLPEPAACLVTKEGYLSTTPADGLDGFFGARLARRQ
jgi:16S rRNA C967 or C1407 C5-methylase (RsmB/RsmF family)